MNIQKYCATLMLLLGVALSPCGGAFAATDVAGVRIDDDVTVAGQKLVLNGAGIRVRFVQVYVAALYLPQRRDNIKDIMAVKGARRVVVSMLREISNDELGSAFLSAIRKNITPDETQRIGVQLVRLGEMFGSIPRLKKGEFFTIDWVPGTGTVISVDGRRVIDPLPDEGFYEAMLKIWLGPNPPDAPLKRLLLGQKPEEAPTAVRN